jgi:hypothetical protein
MAGRKNLYCGGVFKGYASRIRLRKAGVEEARLGGISGSSDGGVWGFHVWEFCWWSMGCMASGWELQGQLEQIFNSTMRRELYQT